MTEYRDQDLGGVRFERVRLPEATFENVDLSRARIRGAVLAGVRMRGVELVDVEITGEVRDIVVNGVDIAPLVEAELNRRMPERAKMRPEDADGFREAWAIRERLWEGTVARARRLPEAALHRRVEDEWSFVHTLRHLNFAGAGAGWSSATPRRGTRGTCRGRGPRTGRRPLGPRGASPSRRGAPGAARTAGHDPRRDGRPHRRATRPPR